MSWPGKATLTFSAGCLHPNPYLADRVTSDMRTSVHSYRRTDPWRTAHLLSSVQVELAEQADVGAASQSPQVQAADLLKLVSRTVGGLLPQTPLYSLIFITFFLSFNAAVGANAASDRTFELPSLAMSPYRASGALPRRGLVDSSLLFTTKKLRKIKTATLSSNDGVIKLTHETRETKIAGQTMVGKRSQRDIEPKANLQVIKTHSCALTKNASIVEAMSVRSRLNRR